MDNVVRVGSTVEVWTKVRPGVCAWFPRLVVEFDSERGHVWGVLVIGMCGRPTPVPWTMIR
jgi:hypothetical protein